MHKKYMEMAVLAFSFVKHAPALAEGDKIIAASGTSKVTLFELYSSESCSSCPPADQWVSKLESHKDLWSKFVPVVFHVDYWNHLSWKDKLSSSEMTTRQIAISKTWARPSVYTPGVIINGSEWPMWRDSTLTSRLIKESSKITLNIIQTSTGSFQVQVSGRTPGVNYVVYLAKLGVGIRSKIDDGENSGKILTHNFVVLDWHKQSRGSVSVTNPLKFAANKQKAKKNAVVAWIEEVGRYSALQATGAFL